MARASRHTCSERCTIAAAGPSDWLSAALRAALLAGAVGSWHPDPRNARVPGPRRPADEPSTRRANSTGGNLGARRARSCDEEARREVMDVLQVRSEQLRSSWGADVASEVGLGAQLLQHVAARR